MRRILDASSVTVPRMAKKSLHVVLSENLAWFMNRPGCHYPNAHALSARTKISRTTIGYLLKPGSRPYQSVKKSGGYPTLDKLEIIADALGCHVWELLHPNIEQSKRERDMYAQIERDYLRANPRQNHDTPEAKV